jgi:hypothetical protein
VPEPDFVSLERRLDATSDTSTARAALEILETIAELLPPEGRGSIAVRDVLERTRGIVVLRVSDAHPSDDPVIAARSAAQYAFAMIWSSAADVRAEAMELFIRCADEAFAGLRANGSTVQGCIYYVRHVGQPEVKIGYASKLKPRLSALSTAMASGIELLCSHPGTMADESELHARFAHLRTDPNREWFRPGEDLLAHIQEQIIHAGPVM